MIVIILTLLYAAIGVYITFKMTDPKTVGGILVTVILGASMGIPVLIIWVVSYILHSILSIRVRK